MLLKDSCWFGLKGRRLQSTVKVLRVDRRPPDESRIPRHPRLCLRHGLGGGSARSDKVHLKEPIRGLAEKRRQDTRLASDCALVQTVKNVLCDVLSGA